MAGTSVVSYMNNYTVSVHLSHDNAMCQLFVSKQDFKDAYIPWATELPHAFFAC
jgi:hypothetical protein